jgi:hypothetical protein
VPRVTFHRRCGTLPAAGVLASLVVLLAILPAGTGLGPSASTVRHAPAPAHRIPIPFLPLPHRTPNAGPTPQAVNPYQFYSSEPAPMGIADFGVDGHGNGYRYASREFVGSIMISSLHVNNPSLPDPHDMGVQLNVVLSFSKSGSAYYYWIQDVLFYNTSTAAVGYENNIWNFSGPSATMYASSVSGNGSVYSAGSSSYYAVSADPTLPGSGITLSLPQTVRLAVVSSLSGTQPEVAFEYNDGVGWVTYDNVLFPFAAGARLGNFVVDGTGYNAIGLYNDAELILGGPGNGYSTTANSPSNVTVSLEYWNGHNLQSVLNAYDFGSDTAETIGNLAPKAVYGATDGSVAGNLKNGSGSLSSTYTRNYVGLLNVTSPLANGTLALNGSTYGPFVGEPVNVTIAPGTYAVGLYQGSVLKASGTVTVGVAAYVALRLGLPDVYSVTFVENGLPSGAVWAATLNGTTTFATSTSIAFSTANGSFPYAVTGPSGFRATVPSGNVAVHGAAVQINVYFSPVLYEVVFDEVGLPAGTLWQVQLGGSTGTSTNASLNFLEPNGSYDWQAEPAASYVPAPAASTVSVNGADRVVTVAFVLPTYPVTFVATGLVPTGGSLSVRLSAPNGTWSIGGHGWTASDQLANGTYGYSVVTPAGYTARPALGSLTVAGQALRLTVDFTDAGWLVGTVAPASATVEIEPPAGAQIPVTNGQFNSTFAPGTYTILVSAPGYATQEVQVTIHAGRATSVAIHLPPMASRTAFDQWLTSTFGSVETGETVLLLLAVVAVGLAVGLSVRARRRRRELPPPEGAS